MLYYTIEISEPAVDSEQGGTWRHSSDKDIV